MEKRQYVIEQARKDIAELESVTEDMNDVDYASLVEMTKSAQLSTS